MRLPDVVRVAMYLARLCEDAVTTDFFRETSSFSTPSKYPVLKFPILAILSVVDVERDVDPALGRPLLLDRLDQVDQKQPQLSGCRP